jgi:hypothetical protein
VKVGEINLIGKSAAKVIAADDEGFRLEIVPKRDYFEQQYIKAVMAHHWPKDGIVWYGRTKTSPKA